MSDVNAPVASAESGGGPDLKVSTAASTGESRKAGNLTPGYKALPKCDVSLEKEHKTTKQLSEFVFTRTHIVEEGSVPSAVSASSSSSASSVEGDHGHDDIIRKVKLRTESRQGRETQRWDTEPGTGRRIRLVTGCVPILKGGRIMFVSANKKPEWILPKGGWEKDEKMEESAIRECFEEAGVFGTLGPRLSEIQYETRKSKKRRKEMEELLSKKDAEEQAKKTKREASSTTESTAASPQPRAPNISQVVKTPEPGAILPDAVVDRIRGASGLKRDDTASSTASDSTQQYSLVRMTLFPLYVSEVWDNWPEDTRYRKEVQIDEAIDMSRDEFREVLMEIKEKKLHEFPEPKRENKSA